jgi:hypothetical protein
LKPSGGDPRTAIFASFVENGHSLQPDREALGGKTSMPRERF